MYCAWVRETARKMQQHANKTDQKRQEADALEEEHEGHLFRQWSGK